MSEEWKQRLAQDRGWLTLLALGLLALYAGADFAIYGDGGQRYEALEQALAGGRLLPSRYSLVGPLVATPLWFLGKDWACARYNFLLLLASLPCFYGLLRPRLSSRATGRFLLLVVFASMFPFHVQAFYGEVFSALLAGLGLLAIALEDSEGSVPRGLELGGWLLVVLAVVNSPALLAGLLAAMAYYALYSKRVLPVAVVFLTYGLIKAEQAVKHFDAVADYLADHGVKTVLPYSGLPGFSYPFALGLLSLLFCFGKGLLFYTPGVFVPLPRAFRQQQPRVALAFDLWMLMVLGLLLLYSRWWGWFGGFFWGPRFFLIGCLPAALSLALHLEPPENEETSSSWRARAGAVALVLVSLYVGYNGMVFGQRGQEVGMADNYSMELLILYVPDFSVLCLPWVQGWALSAVFARLGMSVTWLVVTAYLLRESAAAILAGVKADLVPWLQARDQRPWRF